MRVSTKFKKGTIVKANFAGEIIEGKIIDENLTIEGCDNKYVMVQDKGYKYPINIKNIL